MARRRSLLPGLTSVGLAIMVIVMERGIDALAVAVAYKAKSVCSGVFVADRKPDHVIAETELDDLAPLRRIRTTVDAREGVVTASAAGLVTRRAAMRGGTGCAIVPPGMSAAALRRSAPTDVVDLVQRRHSPPLPEALPGEALRLALDSVVERAFAEPDTSRRRRTQAIVVVHRGRIVAERYAPGITAETRLLGWSMAKSVMNALTGILVQRGVVALDAPVPIDEWRASGDPRGAITWRHLLHMSSGLRFKEGENSLRSDVIRMLLQSDDMATFSADRGLDAPPGTRWQYTSGTTVLLARAMRNVLADDAAYVRFPREALFDRIGMTSAVFETDAAGTFVGSSLMYATARDWAKFGMLYANDGMWNGERILADGWVDFTATPAPADSTRGYGAHFWLGIPDGPNDPVTQLPAGSLQAAGHENQFVTIVPGHDAVIVRLGRTRLPGAWDQAAFVRDVLEVLERASPSSG